MAPLLHRAAIITVGERILKEERPHHSGGEGLLGKFNVALDWLCGWPFGHAGQQHVGKY